MAGFPYKTTPFDHQREALRRSATRAFYGLFMEQGTGKTKVGIDTVAYWYIRGMVDGFLILAPNGVHTNWVLDEIPTHMSEEVPYKAVAWSAGRKNTQSFIRDVKALLRYRNGLAILAMNIDSVSTKDGMKLAMSFMQSRRVFMGVDESTDIKAYNKRTRAVMKLGKMARARRIFTGTPAGDGNPLDLYYQLQFLSPSIVKINSYTAYKHTFAELYKLKREGQKRPVELVAKDRNGRPRYKNLDLLNKILEEHSYRVLKKDVLDLPEKLYRKIRFEMSPEQDRMYREMRDEFLTFLAESGEMASAPLAMVRYLRLQQIASGYIPVDMVAGDDSAAEPERPIPGVNARLDACTEFIEEAPGVKFAIWCRFSYDILLWRERLKKLGISFVEYHGGVSSSVREAAKVEFRRGSALAFLGNPRAGGRGLTLVEAERVINYSHYWSYETRVQSEDRFHRIGLLHPVLYGDAVASGTIDEKVISALISKRDVSAAITGDPVESWI